MDYKIYNNIDVDKIINYYRINDSVSYNYLQQIDSNKEYSKFLEEFNKLKFSLSKEHLEEISEKLIKKDFEAQKEFIELEPNKFFIYIYNEINQILESKKDEKSKRKNLTDLIIKWNEIYIELNKIVLLPTLFASKNYCYNKSIFDFIYFLKQFLQKRNNYKERKTILIESNESEDEYKSDDENENKIKEEKKIKFSNTEIKNKDINLLKKKRKKSENFSTEYNDNNEYIQYDNDKEFIESFERLLVFLIPFEKVFEIISENENDETNILRIQIFVLNLSFYEKERSEYDKDALKSICNVLQYSVINEQIIDKYDIYYTNKKITKSEWKDIKIDDIVNIKINEEIVEKVKIKYFNSKILE